VAEEPEHLMMPDGIILKQTLHMM